MTEYKDEDGDELCDWCGEPDHSPGSCPDIMDKSVGTVKRALSKLGAKRKRSR